MASRYSDRATMWYHCTGWFHWKSSDSKLSFTP